MHSKMIVLKEIYETDEHIMGIIDDYWLDESLDLSARYNIDYYSDSDIEIAVDILKDRFSDGFKYDKNKNQVTITLKAVVKYLNGCIRAINKFMQENKPVDNFVEYLYLLQTLVHPEHPKVLTSYSGLEDLLLFARALYKRMIYEHVDKLTWEVYKCYDYHI